MNTFKPDYMHIVNAAKNICPSRLPLYDHLVADTKMEEILGVKFAHLIHGDEIDLNLYFKHYCNFFYQMGYDTISFECCVGGIMPDSGALGGHKKGIIQSRIDFEKYPWEIIVPNYFKTYSKYFKALRANMPEGMKAIGGVGNGIFECVQDLVGYTDLCYLSYDDPELYADLFKKVGDILFNIWSQFLADFGDIYCVCRFGDDLGFKSNTLLPAQDIIDHIIPQYKRIVELIHSYDKPFLLHSCGCIFNVMDELINTVKIDAKHSNEDQIAYFPEWVTQYGQQIGNFGGIDTDVLCQKEPEFIKSYILDVITKSINKGGFAFGCGNSIPQYVPASGYLAMIDTVRNYRGDYR